MPRTASINYKSILLEAFFVVLGVVLAFAANNFREQRNNERRAEAALLSIVDELESNHASFIKAIEYHSFLSDTLYKFARSYGNDPERYPSGQLFSKGFINPATPISRAWDAAASTGIIEYIPYDEVLLISKVYENQQRYETQSVMVATEVYSLMFNHGIEGIRKKYQNLANITGSFFYRECELVSAYAEVLPALRRDSVTVAIPQYCNYLPKR